MTGQQVFAHMVTGATQDTTAQTGFVTLADYQQWRESYIFLALQGQRYGQSFCNTFGITDNNLHYNIGAVDDADAYIRKMYLERT